MSSIPDLAAVREAFPSLRSSTAFFENAGGSQVPRVVADAVRDHFFTACANPGANYPESQACAALMRAAHQFTCEFMNGTGIGHAILGPSCSVLCRTLADCYAETLRPGDELIVAWSGHEANIGPWMRLAGRGLVIRPWLLGRKTRTGDLDDLKGLLSPRTRLVAFPHVSNIFGEVMDVAEITRVVHEAGARVVVDGVASAPHLPIDVRAWNVDWYAYSTYKVFAPHLAALYGRQDALEELPGGNHYWIRSIPGRFELGGASPEACAGQVALGQYLNFLAGRPAETPFSYETVVAAYRRIAELEAPLVAQLLEFLRSRPDVHIAGLTSAGPERVGIVAFWHERAPAAQIAAAAHAAGVGIKHGHMSSLRLIEGLGLSAETGVVRVSFAHYNTPGEVDRLIRAIEPLL